LLETGQTTSYHVADDGDYEKGLDKAYDIYTVGQYAGTVNIDVPHYAGNQISFAATTPGTITDAANGLATFLTGDVIVVRGSANNDGVYTISAGGVAGTIRTVEATLLEGAGAYVKIYKRTTHSNNVVEDLRTGRYWSRYTSNGEDVGEASNGALVWWDTARCYALHPAAADLQMIAATSTLRIVGGAGEIARYDAGDIIDCGGFANAANNLPGYYVVSRTVNGADLDLVLDPVNNVLVNEAAAGLRDIRLVCRSIFGYAAAANAVSLGGFTDWRVPYDLELASLRNMEAADARPDAAAFPGWPVGNVWSSTTRPGVPNQAMNVVYSIGAVSNALETDARIAALVRG
jgi:hypothetical protein